MDNFTRKFLTEWRRLGLAFENQIFVAAVSGGADSVSVLLVLDELRKREKLKNRFVIAHFNHGLRGAASESDAEFVKSLCIKFDFEFALGSGKIEEKGNLEQNARLARYQFLKNIAENIRADGVLTAHTINDQAETFLINLLRGSGLQGLSGMRANSRFEIQDARFEIQDSEADEQLSIALVRPLLNWARRIDTENFCHRREIEFRLDAMNDDLSFSRVRVRKILLPMMSEFNPKIVETLARTAEILRIESDEETERQGDGEIDFKSSEISLKKLKNLTQSAFYRFLRKWLEFNRGDLRGLDLKHFQSIERLIDSRKSGKTVELPNGARIVKESGKILFKEIKVEK